MLIEVGDRVSCNSERGVGMVVHISGAGRATVSYGRNRTAWLHVNGLRVREKIMTTRLVMRLVRVEWGIEQITLVLAPAECGTLIPPFNIHIRRDEVDCFDRVYSTPTGTTALDGSEFNVAGHTAIAYWNGAEDGLVTLFPPP